MVLTIGIDFDNTLANYSGVFYQVGIELGWVPKSIGQSKFAVKQYFFSENQHDKWTELQGIVYGNEIHRAKLYKGAKEVVEKLIEKGHRVYIISHKTQYPVIGSKVSLHQCAYQWLLSKGVIGHGVGQLRKEQVFFNQTPAEKIAKLVELKCDYFIDDLPSIFQHSDFPKDVKRVFFDSDLNYLKVDFSDFSVRSWHEIADVFMLESNVSDCLSRWLGQYQLLSSFCGANNRGFLVWSNAKHYFLKCYPKKADCISRIQRELAFTEYAVLANVACVANVIESSMEHGCVLFEYITLDDEPIEQCDFVDQAFSFIHKINERSSSSLNDATDAAFTISDFKNLVEQRFDFFKNNSLPMKFSDEIKLFISDVKAYYHAINPTSIDELMAFPIASPSDFGLHNALKMNNKIYFIDFEYAGKDSLWKFLADFFAQPQYPISIKSINKLTEFLSINEIKKQHISFCYVYQLTLIKWSLLMLQTGIRLYGEENKHQELKHHLLLVRQYFDDIDNKLAQMHSNILDIDLKG